MSGRSEDLLCRPWVEQGDRRAGQAAALAEGHDACDGRVPLARLGQHRDVVADLDVVVVRRRRIDGDLAGGGRSLSRLEAVGVERGVAEPRAAQRRCAGRVDDLAVRAHDLGEARRVALGLLDPVNGLDLRELARRDGWPRLGGVAAVRDADVEGGLAAYADIGAAVSRDEQVVERLVERVAEHQGAGDERHSEDDRRGGQQQSQFAREKALEGDAQHGQLPAWAGASRFFMRSRTDSAVGSAISSTTRPSARKTARSANPAAAGSCVTITMV